MTGNIPSTTLDDVNVTAKAPTSNPTASTNYSPPIPAATDTLKLIVKGTQWEGWQRVAVQRSMDSVPANFDVQVTEKYPTGATIDIHPGDECQVKIGNDLVITGYIDRYTAAINAQDHTVRITGRSKSEDLVDCSAFIGSKDNPSYQIKGGTTLSIAQQLAAPYNVAVSSVAGPGKDVPQFNINLGETPWEIIDRITRYSQLVAYDMPDGSIVLAQAGGEQMSSGFTQGQNIEQAQVNYTMDQRFSEYEGFSTSALAFTTQSDGHVPRGKIATDSGVPRYRKHIIISEQVDQNGPIIEARVQWECARRAGRSYQVVITCDSWRDTAGALWAPNHQAPITLPVLKVDSSMPWTIGQVTYTRDEMGQHAIILLMPKNAFLPEPTPFMPLPPTTQDITGNANNPTAPQTDTPAASSAGSYQETGSSGASTA